MGESFAVVVNEIKDTKLKNEKIKYSKYKCPDITVGINESYWFSWSKRLEMKESLTIDDEYDGFTIVIVLESPHKNEFQVTSTKDSFFDSDVVANPALGNTGDKLQKYFTREKLERLLGENYPKNNDYRIILMNSIQYQCSLGLDPKRIRDYLWLKMWFKYGLKEDFCERLRTYKPDVIINLCTKGSHNKEIKVIKGSKSKITFVYIGDCVGFDCQQYIKTSDLTLRGFVSEAAKQAMKDTNRNVMFYEGNHPSSWKNDLGTIKVI